MLNLAFGWIWITAGFLSGALLGMGFHKEQFMGGYVSWKRRLARLGHIAFFGTGFLNVLVGLSEMMLDNSQINTWIWNTMSWSFIVGAIAMPVCCFIAARWMKAKSIFVFPVIALSAGGVLMSLIVGVAFLREIPL
ncbi:MAG: hypothetical protein P1U42_06160 [Phycisphaerales bacterium]|nr:hypothetical protein [Phycisphaerales bacterium]